jgi:hypothetical protein
MSFENIFTSYLADLLCIYAALVYLSKFVFVFSLEETSLRSSMNTTRAGGTN